MTEQIQPVQFWRNRRVLVTGATGLVGAWLVKQLVALDAYIVAFVRDTDPQSELYRSGDNQHITVVNGQLEDFWAIERAINGYEIDTIFHLGAQAIVGTAHRFPLPTFEANIRGTYNLLEVCRLHRAVVERVVIASSDKAYGAQSELPYTEDMPLNGLHPYEVSKSCADLLAQTYHHTYQLPVAIARCGNVYGGGDLNWSRIVPGTIRSLIRNEPPIIRSDGLFIRDYIYVKDVALAYMKIAECLDGLEVQGQAFNFSTESPINVLDLVKKIQSQMGFSHLDPDIQNTTKGEIRDQYLSAAKARKLLAWQPAYSLDQGLEETISWYHQFLTK